MSSCGHYGDGQGGGTGYRSPDEFKNILRGFVTEGCQLPPEIETELELPWKRLIRCSREFVDWHLARKGLYPDGPFNELTDAVDEHREIR